MEAFDICILSTKQDEAISHRLGESIRAYRLPSNVALPDPSLDYRRIVYDCSGEPMDNAARDILDRSRFLVLICTPDTRDNPAILERLQHFRKKNGQENVVAVIAKGEPVDSFPESFIEKKTVRHILPDMTVTERVETIEPVAADLRGDTERRRREMLHYETVRITASVLGLHPDDLEQRHRARRRRAAMAVLAVAGSVCLIAAGIFLHLGLIAKREGNIAEEQTRLSVSIARRTITELPASFEGEEQALSYINEAIGNARADLEEQGLGELLEDAETGGGS
jgi:hypothetical protein